MKTRLVLALVLTFVLLGSVSWVGHSQSRPGAAWQYKVKVFYDGNTAAFEQWLNIEGADGWELVDRYNPTNEHLSPRTFIFRRLK